MEGGALKQHFLGGYSQHDMIHTLYILGEISATYLREEVLSLLTNAKEGKSNYRNSYSCHVNAQPRPFTEPRSRRASLIYPRHTALPTPSSPPTRAQDNNCLPQDNTDDCCRRRDTGSSMRMYKTAS